METLCLQARNVFGTLCEQASESTSPSGPKKAAKSSPGVLARSSHDFSMTLCLRAHAVSTPFHDLTPVRVL